MNLLKTLLFVALFSCSASAVVWLRISDFKSDYLCFFNDPQGFYSDEGFAIAVLSDSQVETRVVEDPFVKYPLNCQPISASDEMNLAIQCSYPQNPQTTLLLSIDRQSLSAYALIGGDDPRSYELSCQTNK